MTSQAVWLLDFDGVINAISKRGSRTLWDDWNATRIDHPEGDTNRRGDVISLQILWSETVVREVAHAVDSGVDVRWLSTWRSHTQLLPQIIPGLPEIPWIDESILDADSASLLDPELRMFSGPWKAAVAQAFVPEDAPLLWTDDSPDLVRCSAAWRRARKSPTTFIRPSEPHGLIRKHVTEIREWIELFAHS